MKSITLILFLFVGNILCSQEIAYEKGKILDNIPVKNSPQETFALFLPTTFNPEVNSAIIFIFDPSGTAINGINTFKESAEKFDYILVCSNNSKNGPYQKNFDVTNRLFNHVFSEFNIDANRIYTAGFSGGSRLACTIAVLTGAIQGVIGCGAGFGYDLDKKPTFETKFSYVGLVGDEDMNFQEMHNVKDWLDRVNLKNALFTFNGDHNWPNGSQIERALSWMELQAFLNGIKPTNNDFLNTLYLKDFEIATSFEKEGELYQAVNELDRIEKGYSHFFNLDSIKQKISILKASESYKKERDFVKEIDAREYNLSEIFLERFRNESLMGKSDDNFKFWKDQMKILDDGIVNNNDLMLKNMYTRLRNRLSAVAYENSVIYRNSNKWIQALYCDNLLVVFYPNHPYWYFRVAESYANNNQFNPTLKNLEKSMSLGFKRKDLITSSKIFKRYDSKKKFKEFLKTLE